MLRKRTKIPQTKLYPRDILFMGGLDTETPVLRTDPGTVSSSQNVYEVLGKGRAGGGYESFQGYDRFSGQTAPSTASYATLTVNLTGSVSVGDVLTDDAETSYGTVIALTPTEAILTKITGTFSTGDVKVSSVVVGTCTGAQVINGESDADLSAQYTKLAADEYRDDISAMTGSGDVLGTWYYNGTQYAFRNNAGGTATVMYKESSSGWTAVSLGYELSFTSGGTYEIDEGDEIEGETGGATATITRVVLESGTFAGGDAAGRLIFASQTGTFQSETIKVGANLDVATIASDSSAITLAVPSGRFKFVNANFTGNTDTLRMYGCDGVNRAFEFDGTVFVPIETGMTDDTPDDIWEFNQQLFLAYGPSVQNSSPGFPYQWSVVVGAGEFAVGDGVTGHAVQPGTGDNATCTIFASKSTYMLYGHDIDDFNLVPYKNEVGAIEHTVQIIGNTFFLSDFGITKLTTSQNYGNFRDATESQRIQSWLKTKKVQVTASCIVREKNQYWVFFADKTAICCLVDNGNIISSMPMRFEHKVTCISSQIDNSGNEIIFFGSDDGQVRQMYKGTSFDGEKISWFFNTHYDHFGLPDWDKSYNSGKFEVSGDGFAEFQFTYSLGYGSSDIAQPSSETSEIEFSPDYWDSFTWDAFTWDGISLTPKTFRINGSAENISLIFRSNKDYCSPVRFSGGIIKYRPTREHK